MRAVVVKDCEHRVPRRFVSTWLNKVTVQLSRRKILSSKTPPGIVIAFVEPSRIRELNKSFRAKNYATDILSFVSDEPGVLGELVIAPQVIEKQSREHGLTFEQELGYMLLHGVLHLLGYDHERSLLAAREMFKIQDDVFGELCKTSAHVTPSRKRRSQKKPRKST